MHLVHIKNLVNRYQSQDPILAEIFDAFLEEIELVSVRHTNEDSAVESVKTGWGPLTKIVNNLATDFLASGGEVWNVIGVALIINRSFKVTLDNKFMYYAVEVLNSTIVNGGLAQQLWVRLPAGYAIRGVTANELFIGAGNHGLPGVSILESSFVFATDGWDQVRIYRPNILLWPAQPANFVLRFTVLMPVEYQGGITT